MLTVLKASEPKNIPNDHRNFLKALKRPTMIYLPGKDESRTRVLVTLSHGNEPSGFRAVHQWLRKGRKPFVNIIIILGGVEAALTEPLFSHRYPPGKKDLNRCFYPPYDSSQGHLAQAMLNCICESHPESVVDMHNTSGFDSAYAISYGHSLEKQMLAGVFADTLIVSGLRVGSLMEQDFKCPVITVEVGGNKDPGSFVVAMEGIEKYFLKEKLFENSGEISIFHNPLRLELASRIQIGHAIDGPLIGKDITIRSDIESLNSVTIGTGEPLGWLDMKKFSILCVKSPGQNQRADEYFSIKEGRLYPKRPMTLFMATKQVEIAASDCLFYFVCQ